jgi:biopolymer transport protein ExbB/TolQ
LLPQNRYHLPALPVDVYDMQSSVRGLVMTASSSSNATGHGAGRPRRSSVLPALLIGVPLAAAILGVLRYGPLRESHAAEYVKNPVECVEVIMFCTALGALLTKLLHHRSERRAVRLEILPEWDGRPVPVSDAAGLLAKLDSVPARLQQTGLVRRVHGVLDFLCRRGSAAELDDQLRDMADADAMALETSYSLVRFITWAIPILGFLGTVLGITGAISGVTPEVLEKSLSTVTDGLAMAFDTTALALGLTMLTMFLTFLVDRAEQGVLEAVDRYTDRQLAHRFERAGGSNGDLAEVVRHTSIALLKTSEQLVQRQADVWGKAMEEADRRRTGVEQAQMEKLTAALDQALQRTLQTHAQRLAALERESIAQCTAFLERMSSVAEAVEQTGQAQQMALVQVAERIAEQAEALVRLQEGERHLLRLHEALNQNLAAVTTAGTFEQALHSLTAAVHMLTARSGTPTGSSIARPGKVA